jgi:DNA polymerase-3 subunit gamma/tau
MKIEVERAQGPLLEYLKRSLKNYDITLDITVNEEVQRKYAYTPQEKYDKLREQNPALDILRKTFDLDL